MMVGIWRNRWWMKHCPQMLIWREKLWGRFACTRPLVKEIQKRRTRSEDISIIMNNLTDTSVKASKQKTFIFLWKMRWKAWKREIGVDQAQLIKLTSRIKKRKSRYRRQMIVRMICITLNKGNLHSSQRKTNTTSKTVWPTASYQMRRTNPISCSTSSKSKTTSTKMPLGDGYRLVNWISRWRSPTSRHWRRVASEIRSWSWRWLKILTAPMKG